MTRPVISMQETTEEINEAIRIPKPEELRSEDGRIFEIIDWEPSVKLDCMVTITLRVSIKLPKSESKSTEMRGNEFRKPANFNQSWKALRSNYDKRRN